MDIKLSYELEHKVFSILQMKTCFEELEKKQLIEEIDKLICRPKRRIFHANLFYSFSGKDYSSKAHFKLRYVHSAEGATISQTTFDEM